VGCVRLRKTTGFVGALVLACAFPSVAAAADRFAEPGGDGAEPCAQSDPCDIVTAVNGASSGDDVTLLGGVPPDPAYTSSVTLGLNCPSSCIPVSGITVHGTPGARPVINTTSAGVAVDIQNGSILRDVVVNSSVTSASAVGAFGNSTIERVSAHSSGTDGRACALGSESTIRDSVCWNTGPASSNSSGVTAYGQGGGDTATLRNVTAISTTSYAIRARSSNNPPRMDMTLTATNVIARGGGGQEDIRTENIGLNPAVQQVILDHSNYATESEFASGDITDPGSGTNATNPPVFDNAAAGNFHQLHTSNGTIDLGTATGVQPQERDIDGEYRTMGSAPDIGADEFGQAPLPPTITGTDPPSGSNENNPLVIGTAESFSSVKVYESSDCSGPEAGAEVAEEFASPGIVVSVPDDSTTTLTATATNGTGTSQCSAPFTYTEVTTPLPGPPPGASPQPQPTSPAPKKKCKKKKHRAANAAKKKCKRKKKH
jgi:hypothetical protein